jgi:hypothetical protein
VFNSHIKIKSYRSTNSPVINLSIQWTLTVRQRVHPKAIEEAGEVEVEVEAVAVGEEVEVVVVVEVMLLAIEQERIKQETRHVVEATTRKWREEVLVEGLFPILESQISEELYSRQR